MELTRRLNQQTSGQAQLKYNELECGPPPETPTVQQVSALSIHQGKAIFYVSYS
jgi:hypothetical protein